MTRLVFNARSEAETARLGVALAEAAIPGLTIALLGPLGAGKTRLVRALAESLGVDPYSISSPTFVLVHHYQGRMPIYHFDAYRIASDEEFLELGSDEYFAEPGVSVIEWADRVQSCLPTDRLTIQIEVTGESA